MKSIRKLPLLFAIVCALLVLARANNISQVQHVVVVIQENRTPTNLFQLDQTLINNGAHIVSVSQAKDKCSGNYSYAAACKSVHLLGYTALPPA